MNRRFRPLLCAAVMIAAGTAAAVAQTPVDTGWTYQGRLTDGGAPATGSYDLRFTLFADDAGTIPIGDPLPVDGVEVTAGLFTARLDFGAAFAGEKRWLQIEVSPAGQASYTALPLQEITSSPQSLFSMLPWATSGSTISYTGAGVGIGTTSPISRLHVYADESVTNLIETGGGTNAWARTSYRTANGQWDIGTSQNYNGDQLYFYRAGAATTAMNIAPNGNVGIGPSGALTKLHVYDPNSVSERIETGGGTNSWCRTEYRNGNGQWDIGTSRGFNGDQFYIYREGAATVAFAVNPNGITDVRTLRILGGSDLAEPFDVAVPVSGGAVEPGMVVVIDENHPGDLRLTDQPYDGKVAGIVSGANGLAPGMVMKAEGTDHADGQHPIAMTGRVWCHVDASFGAITPGDRLTTSSTPGHAMKASDSARAGGTVIGKAMTGLKEGKGLVLVLVNLQ